MGTATNNSVDFSVKAPNVSSKSTTELYKIDNNKTNSKSNSSKREDFKDVLSSKANNKDKDIQKVDNTNEAKTVNKPESKTETKDTTNFDEIKEKLQELEEESKSASKDDINDILSQLLSLLNKLGVKEEDLKSNVEINSDVLKNVVKVDGSSNSNLSSVMQNLIDLLKTDSSKDGLNTDSLKSMENILKNLSANLADDNTEGTKDVKSGIKNLMSEISNALESKQNQSKKVLTLEDMLNKNYSQDNKESSTENESNDTASSKDIKNVSKEDKFLSSLIDDNKDSSLNKINLFASRTQTVQNQSVETVKGLTINSTTFTDDLIRDVKFMSNNGLKELTVKINPGNLGEITIKLIEEDGVMKANLKANSKETTLLLSQNLVDIKKQLGEQNIKIADVNIELYKEDTTFFSGQGFGRQLNGEEGRSNNNSNGNTVNDSTITEDDLANNNLSNDSNIEFFA